MPTEDEIFDSLQRMRAVDDLFGIDSGRGILGDMLEDRILARDIADGRSVMDALAAQHARDDLFGTGQRDIFSDMARDAAVAGAFEQGADLGESIACFRDQGDLFSPDGF